MTDQGNNTFSFEEAYEASSEYFGKDALPPTIFLEKYALRDNDNNILENTPDMAHRRVAKEVARIEKAKFKEPKTEDEIYQKLKNFERLSLQGGPFYGIGNPYQLVSLGNCFVTMPPQDSYLSILYTDTQISQISSRRGGVGWSLSKLRPFGLSVKNAAKSTTGAVSFMQRFSNTIREVAQKGRRGASLQSISCHHPEVKNFIKAKEDKTKITGSNISVEFTDEFMESLKNNESVELRWPVTQAHADEMEKSFPQVSYQVSAQEIWSSFIEQAHGSGEPGAQFKDKVHAESPGVPYGHIETASNPCGEQFLPEYASCRLLLINLYTYVDKKFTDKAKFNFKEFEKDVAFLQRIGDDLVDLEIEAVDRIIGKIESDPEPEYIKQIGLDLWKNVRKTAIEDRRTGCGFTALGDAIAALGMKYGSPESIKFAEKMQKKFAISAYKSSVEMAKELGAFPQFDPKKDIESDFIKRIMKADPSLAEDMQKYGRRNMVLLTIAPTGSISILTQTTSGIEPLFMVTYTRRKKINPSDESSRVDFVDDNGDSWQHFDVYHKGIEDWMEVTGETDFTKSPYYGSLANEVSWENRIEMQSKMQKYVDNSISVTINLPKEATQEEVSNIFIKAWESGCKGMTVYRDGCRDGVLLRKGILKIDAMKRPKELPCDIYHISVMGEKFFVIVGLFESDPYEIFAGKDEIFSNKNAKTGIIKRLKRGHYQVITEAGTIGIYDTNGLVDAEKETVTRLISTSLRHGVDISFVIQQLERTDGPLVSFNKSIARALKKYVGEGAAVNGQACTNCGKDSLVYKEGCKICSTCGATSCS